MARNPAANPSRISAARPAADTVPTPAAMASNNNQRFIFYTFDLSFKRFPPGFDCLTPRFFGHILLTPRIPAYPILPALTVPTPHTTPHQTRFHRQRLPAHWTRFHRRTQLHTRHRSTARDSRPRLPTLTRRPDPAVWLRAKAGRRREYRGVWHPADGRRYRLARAAS